MKYIICDLDGTLFDVNHRLPLLLNCRSEEDYDKFHAEHVNDKVNKAIDDILSTYSQSYDFNVHFIFITGRHEKFRESTVKQLKDIGYNMSNTYGCDLYMKPGYEIYTPDFVKDSLGKIFEKYGKINCLFVLDDRPATVKIYRDAGLLCLQVKDSKGFIEDVKGDKCNNLTAM